MSLTKATYSMIDSAPVSTLDYGVDSTGTTDATTAFNNARAAARTAGKPLVIYGTPKITEQLSVTQKEHWIFNGNIGNTGASRPTSYLIKAASVAGALVTFSDAATNSIVQYGGIVGENGNTGDGYVIQANSVVLEYPYVENMGQDGIRVGSDTPGSGINANSFMLVKPVAQSNGRHGIHLSDGDSTLPSNANAGTVIQPFCQNNGNNGIYVGNSAWVSIISPLCESNTGWGVNLDTDSSYNTILGGDCEQNVAGDLYQANPHKNVIHLMAVGAPTYSSLLDQSYVCPASQPLNLALNPNFTSNLVWTLSSNASISSNTLNLDVQSYAFQLIPTVAGVRYRFIINVTQAASRGLMRAGSTGGTTYDLLNEGYLTGSGRYEFVFTAISSFTTISFINDVASSGVWKIDSVQLYGEHISNGVIMPRKVPTSAAPTYEKGAIYFDTTLNKLRVGGATDWETITST